MKDIMLLVAGWDGVVAGDTGSIYTFASSVTINALMSSTVNF